MTYAYAFRAREFRAPRELVTAAARCWRTARDTGGRAQQRLHALLAPLDCEMLAPAFDSLMTLYERALGRRVVVGEARALSEDESLLLGLLDGSVSHDHRISCAEGPARALKCAICSIRMMIMRGRLDPELCVPSCARP